MKLNFTFLMLCICCAFAQAQTPIRIDTARTRDTGAVVTIRGVSTTGSELGTIRYLQDSTGGLPVFYKAASFPGFATVKRGDLVLATGKLKDYNGLLEIDPLQSYTIVSSNNPVPAPTLVTPTTMSEANEAKLVKILNGTFATTAQIFVGNTNYDFVVNGVPIQVRITNGTSLVGRSIPNVAVNLTGICSQYQALYQLLLRDTADLEYTTGLYISSTPQATQNNISTTSFNVNWTTNAASSTKLNYGTNSLLGQTIDFGGNSTNHTATLSGLLPSTVYYVQAVSTSGGNTATSNVFPMMTASTSSGEMRVYFNHLVDGHFSTGDYPKGQTPNACVNSILERIDAATLTIDVAMYNNGSANVVNALVAAANRGVRVRYVADKNTSNDAISGRTLPFTVVKGNDLGLMHHKFFVIDAESATNSWIMSGSTNLSLNQINLDFNNLIWIQDQSLARTYTMEMNEMWGSPNATPNLGASKFGVSKFNNTPHYFKVGGKETELYFSPSDATTSAIVQAVNSANQSLEFATLTFTEDALGTAVKAAKDRGAAVRGLIDNINDAGSEFTFLVQSGVNVKDYTSSYIFHHKYGIIDGKASAAQSNPTLVTGSHNWSRSAETSNDENTLIIHDQRITNLYLQEFEARWCEMTGGNCVLGTDKMQPITGFEANAYPNPAQKVLNLELQSDDLKELTITIYNSVGQPIMAHLYSNLLNHEVKTLNISTLPNGTYFVSFRSGNQQNVIPFTVLN
jgi:phosphatidylserine/phosphatidylglycerophosphate/cardiolipin synthase-like enzyme